jgi:coatomer protein complex subunit epsilon
LNRLKPHLVEEKDDYVYRAYIGLGQYDLVIGEISDGPKVNASKRIIKLFAQYLANPNNRTTVVEQVANLLSDPAASGNKTVQMIAATIYLYEDNTKESFRILKDGSNLEQ